MSCEDEDYGWEDPEPIIEVKQIDINVNVLTKRDLDNFIEGLNLCINRKMEKLNLLLKQMKVYQVGECLLVNDRYTSCLDFEEVVKNFGMDIKKISLDGLKGDTYVIGERATKLLSILGISYNWNESTTIKELPISVDINSIPLFKYKEVDKTYDGKLLELIKEVQENGTAKAHGTETFVDGVSQGIESNLDSVKNQLKGLLDQIKHEACVNNRNIQHGTVEILYNRAKQMGYNVKKETKGQQVQLVLTRIG